MRTKMTAVAFTLGVALSGGTAAAQEAAVGGGGSYDTGIGLGVEAMVAGPQGPTFVYQADTFHISAIFAFDSGVDDNVFNVGTDDVEVGGRFFYEIHSGEISDFSVGGGLGIDSDDEGPGDDDLDLYLEGGAQIRAFIAPNVALNASAGLTIEFDGDDDDDDDIDFGFLGHPMASFGLTYFFF